MKLLDPWRRELRSLIPRGFLRRDQREDTLFASDFPRFEGAEAVCAALRRQGYTVRILEGIAHLDGTEDTYRRHLTALPCPEGTPREETLYAFSLARRLSRPDAGRACQPLSALRLVLKALDAESPGAVDKLSALAAECQRRGRPLPKEAGHILAFALFHQEGEDLPC